MASSPEPAPGLGVFVVVNGEEEHCRPDGIRSFFHDRIGSCRIVTSSRSYSNEKTFVTLEFTSSSHARQAIDRFNNYKIHGCHSNVSFFKSRNGGGGGGGGGGNGGGRGQFNNNFRGGRGNHFQGNNNRGFGQQGGWNSRQPNGMRRGRSFGDMHGERMRGMSPNSAARFIEQRLEEKERRQTAYKGEVDADSHRNRGGSRSHSRSRSRSADREYRRSSSGDYRRSRSRSRSASRARYSSRSPSMPKEAWRSPTRSRSRSPMLLLSPNRVVDEVVLSDAEQGNAQRLHGDSDSDSARRRRSRKHRRHHRHSKPDAGHGVGLAYADDNVPDEALVDVAIEPISDDVTLDLVMPSEHLPAVTLKLLSVKRESLEQEFHADVSTIVSVTKLLIGQDKSLEYGLHGALKGCIRDISLRYIEEFQTFTRANAPAVA